MSHGVRRVGPDGDYYVAFDVMPNYDVMKENFEFTSSVPRSSFMYSKTSIAQASHGWGLFETLIRKLFSNSQFDETSNGPRDYRLSAGRRATYTG